MPLQGWLSYGYPATPTAIAALMAGGALNVGFYGIIRFLIGFGGAIPLTWGLIVVILARLVHFLVSLGFKHSGMFARWRPSRASRTPG